MKILKLAAAASVAHQQPGRAGHGAGLATTMTATIIMAGTIAATRCATGYGHGRHRHRDCHWVR